MENPSGFSTSVFVKLRFTKTRDFGGSTPPKSPERADQKESGEIQAGSTKAIFPVRCRKNRPHLPQSRLKSGRSHAYKLVCTSIFARDCARAFSVVRCHRKCKGFAETPQMNAKRLRDFPQIVDFSQQSRFSAALPLLDKIRPKSQELKIPAILHKNF